MPRKEGGYVACAGEGLIMMAKAAPTAAVPFMTVHPQESWFRTITRSDVQIRKRFGVPDEATEERMVAGVPRRFATRMKPERETAHAAEIWTAGMEEFAALRPRITHIRRWGACAELSRSYEFDSPSARASLSDTHQGEADFFGSAFALRERLRNGGHGLGCNETLPSALVENHGDETRSLALSLLTSLR